MRKDRHVGLAVTTDPHRSAAGRAGDCGGVGVPHRDTDEERDVYGASFAPMAEVAPTAEHPSGLVHPPYLSDLPDGMPAWERYSEMAPPGAVLIL